MMQRRLQVLRAVARLALLWETAAAAFWPVLACLAAWSALVLLGVAAWLPAWLQLAATLAMLAGLAWLARRGALGMHLPDWHAAERRLERDSGLPHRPFAVLRDMPSDVARADGLWQAHQARASASLAHLRLAAPDAQLARHDPLALRTAAALLLVSAIVVAGPQGWTRLGAGLLPAWPAASGGAGPSVQAWILPPSYTGQPPVFLKLAGGEVTAPVGSRLTVSVSGTSGTPSIELGGVKLKAERLAEGSFQSVAVLSSPGTLDVGGRFSSLAQWTIHLLPNEAPQVGWTKLPGRAGTSLATSLPWQAAQRWGVARLQAELRPRGRADLPPLVVALPLPGAPRQASGEAKPDLSADPYAGLTVSGRLIGRDVSGQSGTGAPADFVLPARTFHHPLARAIADLRRRLALHPDQKADIAAELSSLAEAPLAPPVPGLSATGVTLNLAASASLLGTPSLPAAQTAQVQARLWTLALALDGALGDAASAALDQAREELRRGLEDHAKGKLSDRALHDKLQALRQALDKRLESLARQAMKQGALKNFDPRTQHLSSNAIDRAMDRLEKALREGRMQDATQALAQLNQMMDQLKNAHIMSQEEAQAQAQQAKKGRQQQGAVSDMVQRETGLLDHAQARAPHDERAPILQPMPGGLFNQQEMQALEGLPPGTQDPGEPSAAVPPAASASPPPAASAQNAHPAPSQPADARTQRALHRALEALQQGIAQSGQKPPAAFDEAGRAMTEAAGALAHHDDPTARDAVGRAIAALQKGGQSLSRSQQGGAGSGGMQLSLQPGGADQSGQGEEPGGDEFGDSNSGTKRDPFGRPVDGNGAAADDPQLRVPEEMEQARSRAIQEELRRRGADRGRAKSELDYIDRLLKPF